MKVMKLLQNVLILKITKLYNGGNHVHFTLWPHVT